MDKGRFVGYFITFFSHRMFKKQITSLLLLMVMTIAPVVFAYACPDANGLVDINCDGKVEIITFGDSITYGERDSTGLGYPGRINQIFPNAQVVNLGVSGESSQRGRSRASSAFSVGVDPDYIIVLEGVNDYFLDDRSSSKTRSNLLSIVNRGEDSGAITLLAKLTAVKRSGQSSWVRSVNNAISSYAEIDFYMLGDQILSSDNLHPNDNGYQAMAEVAANVLLDVSEAHRPLDRDGDGIYDFAEPRFGSSPTNPDTDGDTISDGAEVFQYGSSPLLLDTDGDELTDEYEINTLHSNPANPAPGIPHIDILEVL